MDECVIGNYCYNENIPNHKNSKLYYGIYTMVYICIYITIVTLMRNCIVGDEMAKDMHEEETLSTNGVLSHSKFCYEGYEYYWHYDYQSKSGIVQYYRCKHYITS
jgi:hypothetical protein